MELMILATKNSTPIIGQISVVMGWIMNGIYKFLDGLFGIQNLGLCIVMFSILIYLFMTPLQIKQQKFSKLSSVMQPELMKIQKKYQNKKDQVSMQKMQEETSAVYQKYGVSPTGSCVQLLIQLPILWSLWHVIQNIPAYVGSVKSVLDGVASQIIGVSGYTNILQDFITDNKMTRVRLILDGSTATSNSVIDFLYALSPAQWEKLGDMKQFAGFSQAIDSTAAEISHMQNFLGLNIAEMPWNYIKAAFVGGSILLAVVALLIPLFSWGTQVLNLQLMPLDAQNNDDSNPMANSMKTIMELMKGQAAEQTKGLSQIVQQFVNQMSETMGSNMEQLGTNLKEACEAQATYARNFQRLEESTKLLLEASRSMHDTINISLERQEEAAKKLSETCDNISNELYTFHQMRNLYEK